jgi:hypothetical protein
MKWSEPLLLRHDGPDRAMPRIWLDCGTFPSRAMLERNFGQSSSSTSVERICSASAVPGPSRIAQ